MADLTLKAQCEEAERLLHAGRWLQALTICRRILEGFPRHVGTYRLMGEIFYQMRAYEEAANLFQRVLGVDPECAMAYIALGAAYEQRDQPEEAIWHLERAFELRPGDPEIRRMLLRLYQACDMRRAGRVKLTRAGLARAYLRGQLYDKAIAELRDLVAADPTRIDLHVLLMEVLWRDGREAEAAELGQQILRALPNCLKANLILGRIWLHTEHDRDARACLQRAQALDPENVVAQELFGAHSPLPLRTPRLPLHDQDTSPVELPYLVDDDEVVAEGIIIDGRPGAQDAPEGPPHDAPPDERAATDRGASEAPPFVYAAAPSASPAPPGGMSLIDVQRQYLEEHPDDYQARLDLARRLRDVGHIAEALQLYRDLVQHHYEVLGQVIRDLGLLRILYPDDASLAEVLALAHAREKRQPDA